jgi:peptidoglycan lytic transglycosylase
MMPRRNRMFAVVPVEGRLAVQLAMVLALGAFVAAGCGAPAQGSHDPAAPPAHVQVGTASWYGGSFAGRPTATGEIFDPKAMTAASRTLPLGAVVQVTNLRNGRKVLVRINDRGPYAGNRILDVSEAAARSLGFRSRGTAQVAIDWPASETVEASSNAAYWVQLGAFESVRTATRVQTKASAHADDPVALHRHDGYVRVNAGPFDQMRHAEEAAARLQEAGFAATVVALDVENLSTVP